MLCHNCIISTVFSVNKDEYKTLLCSLNRLVYIAYLSMLQRRQPLLVATIRHFLVVCFVSLASAETLVENVREKD